MEVKQINIVCYGMVLYLKITVYKYSIDLGDGDQRLRYSLTPRLTLEIALLTACRLEGVPTAGVKPATTAAAPRQYYFLKSVQQP